MKRYVTGAVLLGALLALIGGLVQPWLPPRPEEPATPTAAEPSWNPTRIVVAPTIPPAMLTPVVAPARQSAFGLNSHIASRYPNGVTLRRPASLVAHLEVGWVREDVQWARIEPEPGRYDWAWYDRVFGAHRSNGISILGVIGPAVGWSTPEPNDPPNNVSFYAPDRERYAAFAQMVAQRYKGIVQAWEIWNEPENPLFWLPAPDPVAYAELLQSAAQAIKAVDPQVTVLSGGIVPYDPVFLTTVAEQGALEFVDAIAVHPYVDPATPETGQIAIAGVANVRRLLGRYGEKPIWVTEYGWTSGPCERDPQGHTDESEQADYLVRGAVLLRAAGAERVIWYNFKDHPGQSCYGLVRGGRSDEDYDPLKPAGAALHILNQQLGAAEPLGTLDLMPRETVLRFDDADGWGAPFPADQPPIEASTAQAHSPTRSARMTYHFKGLGNDYVAHPRTIDTPLPADTTLLGLWVYGDGSGHMLLVRVADAEGEVLQFRLGFLGAPGWQFLSTSITGEAESGNRISSGNGRLDGALRLRELVVDDQPNEANGSGTIFVDDLVAFVGPEVYGERFQDGNVIVDVVWAVGERTLHLPAIGPVAVLTERGGSSRTIDAIDGQHTLAVGASPIYVRHDAGK